MNYTTNYNLKKPERNEQFNLDDWNNNTDAIDTSMNTNKTNIANNASNISTILTGLSTVNVSDTSSVYYKLMKLIYPVGSLYWSSKSTNPGTLFGGTWVQIKDKFVLACGDTYKTTGATGGASTVTLSVSNIPSHSHTFTPSGKIASTSGGTDNKTATESSHTHTLNSGNTSSSGTTTTTGIRHSGSTGGMSANATGSVYPIATYRNGVESISGNISGVEKFHNGDFGGGGGSGGKYYQFNINVSHTHSLPASYIYGKTDSGSAHSHTAYFTGTQGTTSSNGSGSAFNILPPYVVKYCWERTA